MREVCVLTCISRDYLLDHFGLKMVRTYKCRKPARYTTEQLKAAIEAVKDGRMKLVMASKRFNVPLTTLGDHAKRGVDRIGAGSPTVLTENEEKEIVVSVQVLQDIGFGLTKELVGVVVRDYSKDQPFRPNPFKDGVPGRDWWQQFLKRWAKELSIRKPQHLPTHRAISATVEVMDSWFTRVHDVYEVSGLNSLPACELQKYIWNCDETGFCTATTLKTILAKCGEKDVHETLGGSGRDYITILGAGSADGTRLPPFVVYKGKNLWARWMNGGPAGAMYSVSNSGWMEGNNFLEWFTKLFIPAVQNLTTKHHVVLFFDGHHSHLTLDLIESARQSKVHLICFPPHCTQPLDVSVFAPVKTSWRKILKEHQLSTCAAVVTKEDFPMLLLRLWEVAFLPQHLKSGFIKCGLCPLNRDAIPAHKLSKADPHKVPVSEQHGSSQPTTPDTAPTNKQQSGEEKSPPQDQTGADSESNATEVVINLSGECTVNNTVTPIRLHLKGYFTQLLQKNKPVRRPGNKQKQKPKYYGEALTMDDFYERIAEDNRKTEEEKERKVEERKKKAEEKKKKAEEKKKRAAKVSRGTVKHTPPRIRKGRRIASPLKSRSGRRPVVVPSPSPDISSDSTELSTEDTGVCEECGGCYQDDSRAERKTWMGCDSCDRWFHSGCLGLSKIPDGYWSCCYCV